MCMEQIIVGGIFSFLVTFYAIPVIITVAIEKKLYDVPDERKIHKAPISALGGLGIFCGLIISLFINISINASTPEFQYYLASLFIIFFLGIKDDLVILSPLKKFIGQLLVATILIYKGNLLITSMHGFLGIHQLEATSSYVLTYFTIIVTINAFNLIDGIDGLAGSLGLVSSCIFASIFFINNNLPYAILGFTLAGSILAFLIYNYSPAKIFMGDTGSMLIGLVNVILVIKFIELGNSFTVMPIQSTPAIGFGILLLPLMDTLRVFGIRIFNRRSPFSPDRNHIHHLLLDKGFSHRAIALTIGLCSILFSGLSFTAQYMGTTLLIVTLVGLFFVGISLLIATKPKYNLSLTQRVSIKDKKQLQQSEESPTKVKLVSLFEPSIIEEEQVN